MDEKTHQSSKKGFLIKISLLTILALAVGGYFLNYLSLNSKKSKASGEVIIMRMYPFIVNRSVSDTFNLNVLSQFNQTLAINGYKFSLNFDKSKIKLTKIIYPIATSQTQEGATVDTTASYAIANAEGKITVFATTSSPQTIADSSNPTFATLTFSVLAAGQNKVTINSGAVFINSQGISS